MKQNGYRFSILTVIGYTSAIGVGFCAYRADPVIVKFCLGVLTFLIGAGLLQQLVRPDHWARKSAIVGVLLIMAFSVYRDHVPCEYDYFEAGIALTGTGYHDSMAAKHFWIFTLLLGSMTARGICRIPQDKTAIRKLLNVVVLFGLLTYTIYLASNWSLLAAYVDIAIDGIRAGIQQPAAGPGDRTSWFGRTPAEFRHFVQVQIWTWPPLVISLFLMIAVAQSKPKTNRCYFAVLTLVFALALPAVINATWLLLGQADYLFPQFTSTFNKDLPGTDYLFVLPGLILLSLYLTTRRAIAPQTEAASDPRNLWLDKSLVGWLLIALGLLEGYALLRQSHYFVGTNLQQLLNQDWSFRWWWLCYQLESIAQLIFGAIEYSYLIFLVPFGIGWLWRRRQFSRAIASSDALSGTEFVDARWPQFERHQITAIPVVFLLLALAVLLCVPFGIASYHAWL